MYRALVTEATDGQFRSSVKTLDEAQLPAGDVTIRVHYSSLNYKDALSATGNKGVTRSYPHTPGIDAAGEVTHSSVSKFTPGDHVLVTGYDLGMNTPGGFGALIRVPADWVVPLPAGLTPRTAMQWGTAGFTAALAVDALTHMGIQPGPVLVTGASGGVGSVAVALLAHLGYPVTASTGTPAAHEMLRQLGATTIIDRAALAASDKPLLKAVYGGAVDTVGGTTLATVIKSLALHASVAACGLVGGSELSLTVFPFILRGVNLLGVDSQSCEMPKRLALWQKIATRWQLDLDSVTSEISLEALPDYIPRILAGQTQGRVLVNVSASKP
jgi:putative YhdH/YhfP family quinone oxidoreductase